MKIKLKTSVRTFEHAGLEENDAVQPTGWTINEHTESITLGYFASFFLDGVERLFIRVIGHNEEEYEQEYFILASECDDPVIRSRIKNFALPAHHFFTLQCREEFCKQLPSLGLSIDENGLFKDGKGFRVSDLQFLETLADKIGQLSRAQSLNDQTEVLLDQLIGSHNKSVQSSGPGASMSLYLGRFDTLWSGLNTARKEAGRKLPGEK